MQRVTVDRGLVGHPWAVVGVYEDWPPGVPWRSMSEALDFDTYRRKMKKLRLTFILVIFVFTAYNIGTDHEKTKDFLNEQMNERDFNSEKWYALELGIWWVNVIGWVVSASTPTSPKKDVY